MKKNLLRIFCIVLALTMLVGLMPVLAAEDDITVYVSVSDQGSIGVTKDGGPAAMLEVTVPEGATVEDAIIAAHTAYCPAGTDGYQATKGDMGLWMTMLWGKEEGVGLFCINGATAMSTADTITAQDGDCIDLILYGILPGQAKSNWLMLIPVIVGYFVLYFIVFRFFILKKDSRPRLSIASARVFF